MTLPNYDTLSDKKSRVCGSIVFSRFMKESPVSCKSTTRKGCNKDCDDVGSARPQGITSDTTGNAAHSQQSLQVTISSDNSSPRQPASPTSSCFRQRQSPQIGFQDKETRDKRRRSCMPRNIVEAVASSQQRKYQELEHFDVSRIIDNDAQVPVVSVDRRNKSVVKSRNSAVDTAAYDISLKSPPSVSRHSRAINDLFEQHNPSQDIAQMDPQSMLLSVMADHVNSNNQKHVTLNENPIQSSVAAIARTSSGMTSPLPEISELTSEDNLDLSTLLTLEGLAGASVVAKLASKREFYKTEAEMLRQKVNAFRKELRKIGNVQPANQHRQQQLHDQDKSSWQETGDAWDKIGNMEFAQSFSSKRTNDELFRQRTENYFKKDWEFNFHGHDKLKDDCSGRGRVSRSKFTNGTGSTWEQRRSMRTTTEESNRPHIVQRSHQIVLQTQDRQACGPENNVQMLRKRVSFMTPEVLDECEYDESCVTVSVEPQFGKQPCRPQKRPMSKGLPLRKDPSNEVELRDDGANDFRRVVPGDTVLPKQESTATQTNPEEFTLLVESDVRYNAATTQTENEDNVRMMYFRNQELEVIPEVDEAEFSNSNGDYTKDMVTVKKLLRKYRKSGFLFSNEQDIDTLDGDMPLVQIENIDAVIQYREMRDPDAWFERHANLSQEKEPRETSSRAERISLTVGLSPKSSSQSSRAKMQECFGVRASMRPARDRLRSKHSGEKDSQTATRRVGKISKETMRHWETQNW